MPPAPTRESPLEERAPAVLRTLARAHEGARIALDFTTPLECVVATILSAQSTDAKINEVTKHLFVKYRTPEDYLRVPDEELQKDIMSTGFFNQKTRSLKGMAAKLVEDFDGRVPDTIAELITLPGVARKTANIVQANCYPEAAKRDPDAGIAVDTHVGRVAVRLGWTLHNSKDAAKIERDLMEVVAKERWGEVTDLFIAHGRTICDAKRPLCENCPIEPLCPSSQEAGHPDLYRLPPTARPKAPAKKKKSARSAR
ncbi:MAG: endonuclease III [Actinomycetota bacterium]|nr:endonuclease III [Actinomycetota bacterium]